jgi:hypothetical protein
LYLVTVEYPISAFYNSWFHESEIEEDKVVAARPVGADTG